jgi:hypothetical protein
MVDGRDRNPGFAGQRSELCRLLDGLVREEIFPNDPNQLATIWGPDDLSKLGDIIAATRTLIAQGQAEAKPHRTAALDAVMQRNLGRALGPPTLTTAERERRELSTPEEFDVYDELADDLLELLCLLAEDTGAIEEEPSDTPAAERAYVARRLGRSKAGLESFVSEWRSVQRADLPFVVRKPGLPWLVDMTKFEEWRRSSEGAKATVKRKAGRPPKPRI